MAETKLRLTMVSPQAVYLDEAAGASGLAPRPASLEGQIVGLLPNWRPSAAHILREVGKLLEERFRLKVHRETRQRPIYALAMARSDARPGPRLVQAPVDCAAVTRDSAAAKPLPTRADGAPLCAMRITSGQLLGSAIGMPQLASALSTIIGQPVVDHTGLAGVFDVTVEFRPDFQAPSRDAPVAGDRPPASDAPSIFTALQEQLGLKLESTRGPVDVLVIDHAEKPSDN